MINVRQPTEKGVFLFKKYFCVAYSWGLRGGSLHDFKYIQLDSGIDPICLID